jgi:hypothetical protein
MVFSQLRSAGVRLRHFNRRKRRSFAKISNALPALSASQLGHILKDLVDGLALCRWTKPYSGNEQRVYYL